MTQDRTPSWRARFTSAFDHGRRRWPLKRRGTITLGALAASGLIGVAGLNAVGAALDARPGEFDGPRLQIDLFDPPPPPPAEPGPRLDVLKNAPDGFEPPPPRPVEVVEASILPLDAPDPLSFSDPLAGADPAPKPAAPTRQARVYRSAGMDCSEALTRAEAMVCRDGRLTAADRRLRRTLDQALDEGRVDPRRLLRDQDAWERALDRAAVDGPGALDRLYRMRQAELETALD